MPPKKKASAKRRLDFESVSAKRKKSSSLPPTEIPKVSPSVPSSPLKRSRPSTKVVVTPDVSTEKEFVPTYLHKNLEYERVGRKEKLTQVQVDAYRLILTHYEIPKDLEQSRSYGPLSGSSYEELVIQAYSLDKLKPLKKKVDICTACAGTGHVRDECPTLV